MDLDDEDHSGDDDSPPASGWRRTATLVSGLIGLLVLPLLMLASWLLLPHGQRWMRVGQRGPLIPVSESQSDLFAIAVLTPFVAYSLWLLVRALLRHRKERVQDEMALRSALILGEGVHWQGRRGLYSFTGVRLLFCFLVALGPALCGLWLWHVLQGAGGWSFRLFFAVGPISLFFFCVVPAIVSAVGALREWAFDIFGTVVITDRRIAWLVPGGGRVYREITGNSLIGAAMVSGNDRRGWLTVTERRDGNINEVDLFGMPEPARALEAIERLIPNAELSASPPS